MRFHKTVLTIANSETVCLIVGSIVQSSDRTYENRPPHEDLFNICISNFVHILIVSVCPGSCSQVFTWPHFSSGWLHNILMLSTRSHQYYKTNHIHVYFLCELWNVKNTQFSCHIAHLSTSSPDLSFGIKCVFALLASPFRKKEDEAHFSILRMKDMRFLFSRIYFSVRGSVWNEVPLWNLSETRANCCCDHWGYMVYGVCAFDQWRFIFQHSAAKRNTIEDSFGRVYAGYGSYFMVMETNVNEEKNQRIGMPAKSTSETRGNRMICWIGHVSISSMLHIFPQRETANNFISHQSDCFVSVISQVNTPIDLNFRYFFFFLVFFLLALVVAFIFGQMERLPGFWVSYTNTEIIFSRRTWQTDYDLIAEGPFNHSLANFICKNSQVEHFFKSIFDFLVCLCDLELIFRL